MSGEAAAVAPTAVRRGPTAMPTQGRDSPPETATPVTVSRWPVNSRWLDVAWVAFSVINLVAMLTFGSWETVPFHFIWVSLALLYGFRVWPPRTTAVLLGWVFVATSVVLIEDVRRHLQPPDELTEVPLMTAMFLAMVWHARRRLAKTFELERVAAANRELLARERRFIQYASHELRTPITVAIGHAELIEREVLDPATAEDVRIVTDELQRLRRLAERLLLLAGVDTEGFLGRERVDLAELAAEVIHRWAPVPRCWKLDGPGPVMVTGDRDRLALVLDALIENAVGHTVENDHIVTDVVIGAGWAKVTVTDTGSGIPALALERIFDRFARADWVSRPGSSGLGLAIVRAVVEAHGGAVSVQSVEGEGSVFEFSLPALALDGGDTR
jgi:two-component system OmpR family sensor kinase